MNCPKCNGEGKRYAHIKDGNEAYKQWQCLECGNLFYSMVTVHETQCSKEEFLMRQREKDRKNYRKGCMRMYQEAEA